MRRQKVISLFQEAVYNGSFRFFRGESEGLELHQLFAGDLSDRSLVDKRRIRMVGIECRYRKDLRVSCDDRVTFGVTAARSSSDDVGYEFNAGPVSCN